MMLRHYETHFGALDVILTPGETGFKMTAKEWLSAVDTTKTVLTNKNCICPVCHKDLSDSEDFSILAFLLTSVNESSVFGVMLILKCPEHGQTETANAYSKELTAIAETLRFYGKNLRMN